MSVGRQHPLVFISLRPAHGVALVAVLLLAWAGCMLPAPEAETGQLYHHNWWNYYARATYLLKQNRTEEAQADFQRCLGLVSGAKFGNTRDMWRARTYGLHFVEGYFPNRELGVCLLERGTNVTQAIHYLETSLQQEPSGRAKHYLNLARRQQMTGRTVPGPQLRIDSGEALAFTRDHACVLTGAATGSGHIRHLTVGGQSEFIELAAPSLPFARRVTLAAGTNVVSVVAEDLLGQRAALTVVRIADWQPPRLLVRNVIAQGREWLVEGVCRDEFGVAEISLDAQSVFRRAGSPSAAEVPISLRVPWTGASLKVVDLAGNRLECPLNAAVLAQTALLQTYAARDLAMAFRPEHQQAEGQLARGSFAMRVLPPHATALDQMAAWERASRRFGAASAVCPASQTAPVPTADRLRPSLSLRGCQPMTRVFTEDFFVDGTAADGGGLASVTINGEDLLAAEDRGSVRTYFARRIPLDLGTNQLEVVATDRTGNRSAQAVTVIRLRPEYLDEALRLSVGVPPLTPTDAGTVGVRVKRSMETELMRAPVRFRLLERDEGWDFVLREQGLSVSDLADPASALRIGKMVPAEMLLMGKLFTEAKGLTIYLKAVETGNGEVVFASDVYTPDPDASLDDAVAGLVLKIEQGFPLITGEVLRRQGSHVTLNVGRQDGASESSRFLVISAADSVGDAGGQVCKAEGQPVQLKMERVQQNTSTARITHSAAEAIVKEGYHVYTR